MRLAEGCYQLLSGVLFKMINHKCLSVLVFSLVLSACSGKPQPRSINNVCSIFEENPRWYRTAKKSIIKRGGNLHVPMAIIYQESSFKAKARPPKSKIFGFIPGKRASNAYGYAQALKGTWGEYKTDSGNRGADRDDFADAFDFVLWYMDKSHKRNGVSKWDAYSHYLNYHEGQGGFARGTYKTKPWLIKTAKSVDARANRYAAQLLKCAAGLDKKKRGWF